MHISKHLFAFVIILQVILWGTFMGFARHLLPGQAEREVGIQHQIGRPQAYPAPEMMCSFNLDLSQWEGQMWK